MDREFAQVLYRALKMLTAYLENRFGFGHPSGGDYDMLDAQNTQK